jgi:translocation and assembly module TamB
MVVATGVKIDDVELFVALAQDRIKVEGLSARSGDGNISGSGYVELRNQVPTHTNLTISLENWPAIHNREYKAKLSGQIMCVGELASPKITGHVQVVEAVARPDIGFLTGAPPPPDSTIVLVSAPKPPPPAPPSEDECPALRVPLAQPKEPSHAPPTTAKVNEARGLSLDLAVNLRRNIWIKQENGSAELAGDLHITKTPTGPVKLAGEIDIVRGWLTVMGKSFTVSSGKIVFTGGPPDNPSLELTADYNARDYLVHVVVAGNAKEPTLTFKSEPDLAQADILSVLMFGKPAGQLSGSEKTDLSSRATELASGFAAAEVGRQLSEALGLEDLGLDVRQTGSGVGVGSYVGADTYLNVSEDMSRQGGQRVGLEHHLSKHWEVETFTTSRGNRGANLMWHTSY